MAVRIRNMTKVRRLRNRFRYLSRSLQYMPASSPSFYPISVYRQQLVSTGHRLHAIVVLCNEIQLTVTIRDSSIHETESNTAIPPPKIPEIIPQTTRRLGTITKLLTLTLVILTFAACQREIGRQIPAPGEFVTEGSNSLQNEAQSRAWYFLV